MLPDDPEGITGERRRPDQHEPERAAEGVKIGAPVHDFLAGGKLLRAGVARRAHQPAAREVRGGEGLGVAAGRREVFHDAEVDDFDESPRRFRVLHEHQICRLDVAMDQVLAVRGAERAGHLLGDDERLDQWQRPPLAHAVLDGFALDQLHRVEAVVPALAEMKHAGHMRMAQARCGAGLVLKTVARAGMVQGLAADDFQDHRRMQIRVDGFVGDAHRPASQLPQAAVVALHDAVVLEHRVGLVIELPRRRRARHDRRAPAKVGGKIGIVGGADRGVLVQAQLQQAVQTAAAAAGRHGQNPAANRAAGHGLLGIAALRWGGDWTAVFTHRNSLSYCRPAPWRSAAIRWTGRLARGVVSIGAIIS